MKPDFYARRRTLRQKGIQTLARSAISFGFDTAADGTKQRVACFDSVGQARDYMRNVRTAGPGESAWPHHGWYANDDGGELYLPLICQWGHYVFFGYVAPGGTVTINLYGYKLDPDGEDFEECQRLAARQADRFTERLAEKERDYQEQRQKARELQEEIDELRAGNCSLRRSALRILRGIRESTGIAPDLLEILKQEVTDYRNSISKNIRRIAEARAELKNLPEV